MSKYARKIKIIAAHSTNRLITPVSNLILSWIVIHYKGVDFWGQFVVLLLIINLSYQALSWGHRDYLLKSFSQKPRDAYHLWFSNLTSRTVLMFLSIIFLFLTSPYSLSMNIWLALWLTVTFLFRAFDVVILFEKRFKLASILEIISAIVVVGGALISIQELTPQRLVMLMGIATLFKALMLLFFYSQYFRNGFSWKKGLQSLVDSFGFFLPAITSFVQNRIDIYVAAFLVPQETLGAYHVLLTFLTMTHSLITFGLNPFIKNLYRVKDEVVEKINRLVSLYGVLFCTLAIGAIYIVITYYYGLEFDNLIYLLALLQLIPFSNFQVKIYRLFKAGKQYAVVWVALSLAVLYLGLVLILIPRYQLSGALAANAINQWMALLIFHLVLRHYQKPLSSPQSHG